MTETIVSGILPGNQLKKSPNAWRPIETLRKYKFGRLKILSDAEPYISRGKKYRRVLALCDCGKRVTPRLSGIINGGTSSCGCLMLETVKSMHLKHGLSQGNSLYRVWCNMKTRCNNSKSDHYNSYGGRGIRVCHEWEQSFDAFRIWAVNNGYSDILTIDRIDNNRGYSPDNCRFIPTLENRHNCQLLKSNNGSGYCGVGWNIHIKKYVARIGANGKRKHLGVFTDPIEAAKAFDAAARELNDGRPLNFP